MNTKKKLTYNCVYHCYGKMKRQTLRRHVKNFCKTAAILLCKTAAILLIMF